MSLLVGWLMDNFVALASDGKTTAKDESESPEVISVGREVPKLHRCTPEIVIAAAGDQEFFDLLIRSLEPLVEQSRGDEQLFDYLTSAIPLAARGLGQCSPTHNEEVLLTGYDAAQKRFRCLRWNRRENFVEHEILCGRVLVMGFGEASRTLARELAVVRLSRVGSLDEVRPTLEEVIREVSALVLEPLNGNVTSCLLYRERADQSTLTGEAGYRADSTIHE